MHKRRSGGDSSAPSDEVTADKRSLPEVGEKVRAERERG